jgi:hypothetical protein
MSFGARGSTKVGSGTIDQQSKSRVTVDSPRADLVVNEETMNSSTPPPRDSSVSHVLASGLRRLDD